MNNNFNLKQYLSEGKLLNEIEVRANQPPLVYHIASWDGSFICIQTLKGMEIMKSILDDLGIEAWDIDITNKENIKLIGNHPLYEKFLKETENAYQILENSSIPYELTIEDFDSYNILDKKYCIGVTVSEIDEETILSELEDAGLEFPTTKTSVNDADDIFTAFIGD